MDKQAEPKKEVEEEKKVIEDQVDDGAEIE
jgi:hypothetical protein